MAILQRPLDGRNPASRYFRWAEAYARKSDHPLHKMGAVIVGNSGGLYCGGYNKNRTHPKSPEEFHVIHAELDALLKARMPVDNYRMFVVRITKAGALGTSKPCNNCTILLKEAAIESVTYIDKDGIVTCLVL